MYFRWLTTVCALLLPLIMIAIGLALLFYSLPALRKFGIVFFFSEEWNPVTQQFGALSSIYGTLVSTILAMLIAVPLSLAIALLLVELAPPNISRTVGTMIELLAAIPSIIHGMWGMFIFPPIMASSVQPWALFAYRPYRHGQDRGIDPGIKKHLHHRHRHPQHAASRPCV